jgi:hypothetical protein
MEEELVFKNKDHSAQVMEIEVAGRVIFLEKTPYGLEITRFLSSNPMDYLNGHLEPRVLQ